MDEIYMFRSIIRDNEDCQETISGEQFRALMELCFDRADKFSLHRHGWPGARDGPLERALAPWRLGEYDAGSGLGCPVRTAREISCVYPASEETKAVFLAHITHLFGRDVEPPEDGTVPMPEKYRTCQRMTEKAQKRVMARIDAMGAEGRAPSDAEWTAIEDEEMAEAREAWRQAFDEADFDSWMDDPWFFRGDGLFFRVISHECLVCVPDDAFGARLQALGRWVDLSDQRYLRPLGFLSECHVNWYEAPGGEKLSRRGRG